MQKIWKKVLTNIYIRYIITLRKCLLQTRGHLYTYVRKGVPALAKKVLNTVTTTLLVLVLALAAALVGVRLFGIEPYTVLSGSMEPTYPVGSLIYVRDVDANDLQVGDPITYVIEGGTVVTHRIVGIIPDYGEDGSPGFKTKGDHNQVEDGTPVNGKNVLGKPIFHIPVLGYLAYFVQNPPGSFFAIGICTVVVLLTFVPDLIDKLFEEEPQGDAPPSEASGDPPSDPTAPTGGENEHPPNSG